MILNHPNVTGAILSLIVMFASYYAEQNTPFIWPSRWAGQIKGDYDNKNILAFWFFSALKWMALGALIMFLIIK